MLKSRKRTYIWIEINKYNDKSWQWLLRTCVTVSVSHDDVIKWKHFSRYWQFERGIHRSSMNSPHKGQWRGALMFSMICAWVNNREAGDLGHYRAYDDVTVMKIIFPSTGIHMIKIRMLKDHLNTWEQSLIDLRWLYWHRIYHRVPL